MKPVSEVIEYYENATKEEAIYDLYMDYVNLQQENTKLKEIIQQLEEWLKEEINIYDEARKMHEEYSVPEERCNAKYNTSLKVLNKLQELKGNY